MRAEDTLQFMLDFYPDLFPTRKHCLDHLFCVIGNGYEWENGELVNDGVFEKRYKMRKHVERAVPRNENLYNQMFEIHKRLKEIDEDYKIPFSYNFEWHRLYHKYSKIFTYPEDIKDDWMNLIEETKKLLIADGVDITKDF